MYLVIFAFALGLSASAFERPGGSAETPVSEPATRLVYSGLMPALAALSVAETQGEERAPGWIAWIAPPFQPYAPALQHCGIDLDRVLIVRPKDDSELLWSAEQALSSGTCAAVLLWPPSARRVFSD